MKHLKWLLLFTLGLCTLRAQIAPTIASVSGSMTRNQGESVSLSVSVNGTSPFTYQWKKGGTDISGATASTYTIEALAITDAGSYTVTITNAGGTLTSGAILLDVRPATAPTFYYQPSNLTYTEGETISFYASVNGTSPMTFVWKKGTTTIATTTNSSHSIANAKSTDSGTYTVTVSNAAGTVTSSSFTVTVNALTAPVISELSDVTVDTGGYISIWPSVSNSNGLTFQWYKDGVAISGATSSRLWISSVQASDAGKYTLKATNAAGTTTSNAATVTVRPAVAPTSVSITSGPVTVSINETLSLYGSANGTGPLTYQWRKDGVDIPGATSGSYYKSGVTANDSGTYSLVATNSVGSATSTGTVVSVSSAQAPIITRHPSSQTVYPGDSISFAVEATGTGQLSYQWKKDGVDVANATSSYYYVTTAAASSHAGTYSVTVSSTQGTVTSQSATLTVLEATAPTISRQPASQSILPGQTLSLSVDATGHPYPTYQWRKDGVAISGATSSYYNKSGTASSDSGSYTVVVSNSAGTVTSAAAVVNIGTPSAPRITSHPASASLLPGDSFYGLSVGLPWSDSNGATFQWYRDGVAIKNATSSQYYISSAQPSDAGTYKVIVTNSAGSTTSYESVITVDLSSARPVIIYTPGSRTVTGGEYLSVYVNLAPNVTPTTITWKKDGVVVPNATSATLSLSNFTRSMIGTYTAEVVTSTGTYTGHPIVLELLNDGGTPTFVSHPASVEARAGTSANFSVTVDGEAPITYQWKKNGADLLGATSSNYGLSNLTAVHAGNYTVVATNRNGSATSDVASLTVVSATATPPVIRNQPASCTVTVGNSFGVSVGTMEWTSDMTYQWYKDGTAITGATYSNYNVWTVTTESAGRYSVKITNAGGTVTSTEALVTVTARATGPTFTTQPTDQAGYVGGSATFSAAATGGTITYQWRKNGANITGATGATLTLTGLVAGDAGNYTVLASNDAGTSASSIAVLTVNPSTRPAFTTHPVSQNALYGGSVTFTASANGEPAPTYQWRRNDSPISGATSSTLTRSNLQASDAGTYTVVATNAAGSVVSNAATLQLFTELPVAPSFTLQPQSLARTIGGSARLTVAVTGTAPLSLQWYKNGAAISGATSTTLSFAGIQRSDAGDYHAVVTNAYGSAQSATATLSLGGAVVSHVYFGTLSTGESWALAIYSDGTGVFLGHLKNTEQAIVARDVTLGADGSFSFGAIAQSMSVADGSADDPLAPLSLSASRIYNGRVTGRIVGGTVTGQIGSATLTGSEKSGTTAAAVAGGYDAVPLGIGSGEVHVIAAPDGSLLLVDIEAGAVRAGVGTVTSAGAFTVSTAQCSATGNISSNTGTLTGAITPAGGSPISLGAPPSSGTGMERLVNVSTRGLAGVDSETLIVGFVITGNAPKDVLVRAVGPALGPLGVTGYLTNPRIKVFKGSNVVMENDDWSSGTNASALAAAAARLGASPLPSGSADAAVYAQLAPGVYSVHVNSNSSQTGVALMEVYDASSAAVGAPKVINLSARSRVGRGDDLLIIGFVVEGNAPKRVLVRGVGPGLNGSGVTGFLTDPKLKLFRGSTTLNENDNWSSSADAADMTAAAQTVGAAPLVDGSKDAAMLVYLLPGVYSAHVSGVNDTTGVALVEVYEVP